MLLSLTVSIVGDANFKLEMHISFDKKKKQVMCNDHFTLINCRKGETDLIPH